MALLLGFKKPIENKKSLWGRGWGPHNNLTHKQGKFGVRFNFVQIEKVIAQIVNSFFFAYENK